MNILLPGASGRTGRHILQEAIERGHPVVDKGHEKKQITRIVSISARGTHNTWEELPLCWIALERICMSRSCLLSLNIKEGFFLLTSFC